MISLNILHMFGYKQIPPLIMMENRWKVRILGQNSSKNNRDGPIKVALVLFIFFNNFTNLILLTPRLAVPD